MGQHSPVPPDDCRSCAPVFAWLKEHEEAGGGRVRVAEIGTAVGLGVRATRVHLAHLEQHRRLRPDRRTPVPGATVQPTAPPLPEGSWPDPIDWAVTVVCPDRTCRRALLIYAREADRTGTGQMSIQALAEKLNVTWRTAQTHRAHLVAADLLRLQPDGDRLPSGHPLRRADVYVLASSQAAPHSGQSWEEDSALDILRQVPWWPGAAPGETEKAVGRLLQHLRRGWPPEELVRRLTRISPEHVISRIGLLRKLCPGLGEAYVVPAMQALADVEPVEMVECPECERPYPRAQRVYEGQVCRDCRPTNLMSGVPLIRGSGTPRF